MSFEALSSSANLSAASQVAIRANGLGKHYHIYAKPHDRLLQTIWRGKRQFYRDFQALENINFELARGQTLGVIGRNGAGKSTLLQLICGTLAPTAGTIEVQGRIAALLELGTGFNPEFTGRENVAINAAILGLSQGQIDQRMDAILAFADIGEFIEQPVKTYSSGMYVRLAFAVAVHVEPDILVVDEALAVGDAFFQAKCMTHMKKMLDNGTTLLFTSHDVSAIKAICQRVLWLERGKVRAFGDTSDITRQYAQEWVLQANAAQGIVAKSALSEGAAASMEHVAAPTLSEAELQTAGSLQTVGTGAARLSHMGWVVQDAGNDTVERVVAEQLVNWGDTVHINVQLNIHRPCSCLVVSYHLKNRQNQHVVGAHTYSHPQVYERQWQAGESLQIRFAAPIVVHEGQYALTMLVTSISDMARYTDAVFHDWVDDVAILTVAPRSLYPLSDMVEIENTVQVTCLPPSAEQVEGSNAV